MIRIMKVKIDQVLLMGKCGLMKQKKLKWDKNESK
jgi:hypothetical protein